jgi:Winged helix-turn helix
MSDGELRRLEVMQDLDRRRLTTAAAGQLLGLERRQVFRLLKAYRAAGAAGLLSKRRGRRSNRRKPEAEMARVSRSANASAESENLPAAGPIGPWRKVTQVHDKMLDPEH